MAVQVTGIDKVLDTVKAYTESLKKIKPLFEKIEEELEKIANESIENQKSATTGQSYKDLSPVTMKKTGKGKKDALKGRTRIVTVDVITDEEADLGISMPYGEIQQFGNPTNKYYEHEAPIPARPFLPVTKNGDFTKKFQNRLDEITQEWLNEQVNKRTRR